MSSFDTPKGTRSARVPPMAGPIGRWLTKLIVNRVRKKGRAPGLGFNALALTTVGRKSGLGRTTPVGYFPGNDGSYLIVASNMGAERNPAWYHNLAANPDKVRIETAGKSLVVTAEQLGVYKFWFPTQLHRPASYLPRRPRRGDRTGGRARIARALSNPAAAGSGA